MNRLESPKAPSTKLSSSAIDFNADQLSLGTPLSGFSVPQSAQPSGKPAPGAVLFAPIHYERHYAYPLLVWLHGEGGSERDLLALMPHVSVRNYVAAAVCGVRIDGAPPKQGHTWLQTPGAAADAAQRVAECIESARQRFNVHPERVFLAGHGPGGTMALRLALQYPLGLAGAASLSGPLPRGNCPLGRINEARSLPLLLATCRDSASYPPAQVALDLRLLHAAGFSLALRQYPCGDELTTAMLSDLDRWMMQHVCQPTPAAV